MPKPGARESRIRLKLRGLTHQDRFAEAADRVPSGPRHRSPVLYSTAPRAETWPKGQGPRRTSTRSCQRGGLLEPQHTPSRTYRGHLCDEIASDRAAMDAQEEEQTAAPVVVGCLFRLGDEVEHGRFGRGLIMSFCSYEAAGQQVEGLEVEFYDGRVRRFALNAAPECLDLTRAMASKAELLGEAVVRQDMDTALSLSREVDALERQLDELVDGMAGGLETVATARPYQRGDKVAHPVYGMGQVVRVRFWARTHKASEAGVVRSLVVRFPAVGLVLDLPANLT